MLTTKKITFKILSQSHYKNTQNEPEKSQLHVVPNCLDTQLKIAASKLHKYWVFYWTKISLGCVLFCVIGKWQLALLFRFLLAAFFRSLRSRSPKPFFTDFVLVFFNIPIADYLLIYKCDYLIFFPCIFTIVRGVTPNRFMIRQ